MVSETTASSAISLSVVRHGSRYVANLQIGGKQIDNFARLDGEGQRVFAGLRQGGN
jgi:hypothetical protein